MTFYKDYIRKINKNIPTMMIMVHCWGIGAFMGIYYETRVFPKLPANLVAQLVGVVIGLIIMSAIEVCVDRKYGSDE